MNYVYSTATSPIAFVKYKEPSEGSSLGHNQILKRVVIKGGHGLADKHVFTPCGVATQVNDEDMEFLLGNDSFQKAIKDGFMTYDKRKVEPEKKAKNMAEKDKSAPLTPKDFDKGENDSDDVRIYKGLPKTKVA